MTLEFFSESNIHFFGQSSAVANLYPLILNFILEISKLFRAQQKKADKQAGLKKCEYVQ